jgi:AraC family ethanolamine operon transcriptional activator
MVVLPSRRIDARSLSMLFETLHPASPVELQRYADIDQFRESERYASAESMPLKGGRFEILRANLALPDGALSLVRTFPRLIRGYDLSGRLVMVVPMDGIGSARINGQEIGQAIVIVKGEANCTVYEPEGRLVAILAIRPDAAAASWLSFDDGWMLLRLSADRLAQLQLHLRSVLEGAARHPAAIRSDEASQAAQDSLLGAFAAALKAGEIDRSEARARYKEIVDHIERSVRASQTTDFYCTALAAELGVSVRTMSSAVHAVCGTSPLRYSQLQRLWAVRHQLRNGAPGLTVRASAFAHGFWHMGDFSRIYQSVIGELPSQTLANARN